MRNVFFTLLMLLIAGGVRASSIKFELDESGLQADVFSGNGGQELLSTYLFRGDDVVRTITWLEFDLEKSAGVAVQNLVLTSVTRDSSDDSSGESSGGTAQVLGEIPFPALTNVFTFSLVVRPEAEVELMLSGALSGRGTVRVNVPQGGLEFATAVEDGPLPEEQIQGRLLQVNAAAVVPETTTFYMVGIAFIGIGVLPRRKRRV